MIQPVLDVSQHPAVFVLFCFQGDDAQFEMDI